MITLSAGKKSLFFNLTPAIDPQSTTTLATSPLTTRTLFCAIYLAKAFTTSEEKSETGNTLPPRSTLVLRPKP